MASVFFPMLLACLTAQRAASPAERSGEFNRAVDRCVVALVLGRLDDALVSSQECLELRPEDSFSAFLLACIYSRKGEVDRAIEWLEKSIASGCSTSSDFLQWTLSDSDFDPLRNDPRFSRLLEDVQECLERAQPAVPAAYIDWTGGHRTTVPMALFSPDGSKVVTVCQDGWGRIWDSRSGELLVQLVGHRGMVKTCAWLDDGRRILTGGMDGTLRSWDARSGDLLRTIPGAFTKYPGVQSPDGRFVLNSIGKSISLIDCTTGESLTIDVGSEVYGVAISPDGDLVATASADGMTRLFDRASRESRASHKSPSAVFDVAFTPDGHRLATAGSDGAVRCMDARTLQPGLSFQAHRAEVNRVAVSPDGSAILTTSVDRTAKVWSAADGSLQLTLAGHDDELTRGAFSPDGQRILTACSDATTRMWDARSGDLLLTLGGRVPRARRQDLPALPKVAFTSDNTRLVTFDVRGAREWNLTTGQELAPRSGYTTVRVRQGRGGAPCEFIGSLVGTSSSTMEIDGVRVGVDTVLLAPGGRSVFTADWDDRGRLWDARSGRLVRELGALSRRDAAERWKAACFSDNGELLASAQQADGTVRVWETSTGEQVASFPASAVTVQFDPSGERLAVGRDDLCKLDVWSLASGECTQSFWGHAEIVNQIAFSGDGQSLATSSGDGTVRLWNIQSGECSGVLRMLFPVDTYGVAFSHDDTRVAAATRDHRVLLWDVRTLRPLGTIVPGEQPFEWLAFGASGHYHGTSASIARSRLVQGAISYPLSCFAAALESPEQVAASFAGDDVRPPKLTAPPSLAVLSPAEHTSTARERVVSVQAAAMEPIAGLAGIEVVQDGQSVPAAVLSASTTLEQHERLARLDLRLPIPAGSDETTIKLQAVSTQGIKSRPETFVVRYEPPKRELYVLALGVADYADDSLDLAYPVQDVDGLVGQLEKQEGELFNNVHVERRADREVTSAEALRLRDEFLLRARPEDTILVFVAGHGVRTDTGEYWLLTRDATPQRPYTGIKRADLESLVTWDKLHATKRVLLLDTCHSGAAFGKGARGERGIAFQQSEVDTLLERSSGLYILAATSDDGFAREQEGNGLFTRALLDGLAGAADSGDFGDKDGTVGINELMHYARYAVLESSLGRQQPTFPRIEGGENFPLARAR